MDGKLKITARTILGILLPDQKALRKPELSGPAHDGPFHGMKWRFPEPAQLQRRSPEAAMIMTTSETFVINMVCFYSNCKYGSVPYLCVCVCIIQTCTWYM